MRTYIKNIFAITMPLLLITISAHAQYVWLDEKGVKQYSDMPPPTSVPTKRILKTPNRSGTADTADQQQDGAAAAASAPSAPPTVASRNEDFMKRRAEQAAKDKKDQEAQQAKADKTKNCERARSYQQTLESGVRVSNTDSNGERSYLSDEQRAKDLADVKRSLAGC